MLEKCKVIYKGDIVTAKFYILVGLILLFFALFLTFFVSNTGYKMLSTGLYVLMVYCTGKGLFMWISYSQRLKFYDTLTELNPIFRQGEIEYTEYRIMKKQKNRRSYIYIVILSSVFAFAGIFSAQKVLIMATAIPIALISGLETGLGLLTEFRLSIFLRALKRGE